MSHRHHRRKTGGGRFARLPLAVLEHPAVTTLDHAAFRVLVLLASAFTGYNNGAIGVTYGQARCHGIGSRHTYYGALRVLAVRGLIEMTAYASRVPPRPTMYALSWLAINDTKYTTATRVAMNTHTTAWKVEREEPKRVKLTA